MPYENDSTAVAWFEHALNHELPAIRRSAIELLRLAALPERICWLERAVSDEDPKVSLVAELTLATLGDCEQESILELMESDFGDSLTCDGDLEWQWEYVVVVCPFGELPLGKCLAWTGVEDDGAARAIALVKMEHRLKGATPAAAIITNKSLVNQYTRSARSFVEAMRWRDQGRPRYGQEPR